MVVRCMVGRGTCIDVRRAQEISNVLSGVPLNVDLVKAISKITDMSGCEYQAIMQVIQRGRLMIDPAGSMFHWI
jgi:hypothetical protein